MQESKPKLLILLGPTACRKTYYSLLLAQQHNAEIISADSMLIYKHLDIGTAKPSKKEQLKIPHHMIDVINPDEYFSAKDFEIAVDKIISDIHKRGKSIIVVGGTGFFIKALTHGLFDLPKDHLFEIREKLEMEDTEKLYERLIVIDPEKARVIHHHDRFRIIRALEVFDLTGKPISEFQHEHAYNKKKYQYIKMGLFLERPVMYEAINNRVDHMMHSGLEDEVRKLLAMGYGKQHKPLACFAYSYFIDACKHGISLREALEKTKQETRKFAKRQMTWYKKDKEIHWFHAIKDEKNILKCCNDFFKGGIS